MSIITQQPTTPPLEQLHDTIQKGLAALKNLSVILAEETQCLIHPSSAEDILELIVRKQHAFDLLENLEKTRCQLLKQHHIPSKAIPLADWLSQHHRTDTRKIWVEFVHLAQQIKTNNQTNGLLIHKKQEHTNAALSILTASAHRGTLYGANGRPSTPLSQWVNRTLIA